MLINKNLNLTFLVALLPITVFTKEIGMFTVGSIQLDMFSYPFFIITFFMFLITNKITFRISEIIFFTYLITIGIVNILLFDLQIKPFLKQIIPIIIIYFSIKTILINNAVDIFKRYVDLALIAALIGILQLSLKLVGINFLTPLSGFYIDSVALEPSHYVLISLPATIYYIETKNYSWKFYTILLTVLLTFKVTALISIVVYFLLRNFKHIKRQLLLGSTLTVLFVLIVNQVPEFSDRFYSMLDFFNNNQISQVQNLTTFSFVSNLEIAINNFYQTWGLGIGIGGHEEMYYRNMTKDIYLCYYYGINAQSAHSLSIRVFSEIGLIGILLYISLIYNVMKITNFEYAAVAWASVSHFIVKSFKLGGYFDYGTLFFLVMIITMIRLDKENKGIESSKY